MKKVYIAGFGQLSFLIQDLLELEKIDFKGYVSLEKIPDYQLIRGGYPLLSTEQLEEKEYDYLILCDKTSWNKDNARMISLWDSLSIISMQLNPEFFIYRQKALRDMMNENACGCVTGISCIRCAVNIELMNKKWSMCACSSQDLYYDFFAVADAIKRMGTKLKYVVMGIVPYSFRYDASLSTENYRKCLAYYREFGELHNLKALKSGLENMEKVDRILDELCRSDWRDICFDFLCDGIFKSADQEYFFEKLSPEQQQKSLEKMQRLGNKPYPDTVEENKMVFDMYLKLCARHNIKVTVLIPPFSEFFREHFPDEYVKETRSIIQEYCGKYDFEVLDLYDSPDFLNNSLYADEDHLNVFGATKLTKKLDEFLAERVYD